eukprot:scaffold3155_cov97-Skeletonema_dohrnii-CCMP3373.AAC.13
MGLDLTGGLCAASSSLSAWPARGRDGFTHTHSFTHSLTLYLSLSSSDCFVLLIVLFGHVISITPHRLHLLNLLLIYNPTPPFQQPLLHCGGELAEPRSNYGLEVVGSLSRCGWHRFRATGKDQAALFPGRNLGGSSKLFIVHRFSKSSFLTFHSYKSGLAPFQSTVSVILFARHILAPRSSPSTVVSFIRALCKIVRHIIPNTLH